MKLMFLDFAKPLNYEDECIVSYTSKYAPMIISCKMKYDPDLLIRRQEYDASVKFWSFCWWSDRAAINHSSHITSYCLPFSFISTTIEELLEVKLDVKKPFVRYLTTLAEQKFEMKLCYPERDIEDGPIKDTFEVGDRIVGLFKAIVKIKKPKIKPLIIVKKEKKSC